MKKVLFALCAVVLTVFPAGCPVAPSAECAAAPQEEPAIYQRITPEEAKKMMDSGKPFILLDVRTEAEYAELRIEGAILIPDYEIIERAATGLPDKSALILIYCRSGRRSADAANELIGMGYRNVYDFGGIIDWPFETVSG
jgi:rhodanese-related sulfurtransferase